MGLWVRSGSFFSIHGVALGGRSVEVVGVCACAAVVRGLGYSVVKIGGKVEASSKWQGERRGRESTLYQPLTALPPHPPPPLAIVLAHACAI